MTRIRPVLLGILALVVTGIVALVLVRDGPKSRSGGTRATPESRPPPGPTAALDAVRVETATARSPQPPANEQTPVADRGCELPVVVQDRATGQSLPDVPVELRRSSSERVHAATSGSDGRCRLVDLEPGEYALKPGSSADLDYVADPVPVALTGDVHEEVVLSVERRWFLAGIVIEAGSDRPIPGLRLMARDPHGRLSGVATSAEGGRFRSRKSYAAGTLGLLLSEGETQGLMRTHGAGPELVQVEVGRDDVTHLRVEVDWVGVLGGVVLDARDRPIAGAELRVLSGDSIYLENASLRFWGLYEEMRREGRTTRSNAEGRFAFGRLPKDRTLVVVASAPGFASGRSTDLSPPFLANGDPVVLRLADGGSIAGSVRDAKGEAVEGIAVAALSANTGYQPDPTRTDAQGDYHLEGLKPGETEVTVLAQETGGIRHAVASGRVEVIAGEEARLDLRIGADGVHLSGVAVDQEGRIITAARTRLSLRTRPLEPRAGEQEWGFDSPVRDDGTFDVTVPREGRYQLTLLGNLVGDRWEGLDVQAPARDLRVPFTVVPTGELAIRAVDAATGEPIERGGFAIGWDRGSLSQDFLGGGLTWTVREGLYTLTVDAKGYAPASQELDLRGRMQPRIQVEMRLDHGRPLSGVVRDAEGRPVKGCTVVLRIGRQLQLENLVYSGVDGRFTLPAAPATGGSVCVIDESYETLAAVEIGASEVALTIGVK